MSASGGTLRAVRRPGDWHRQAEADLEAAERLREAGRYEWACFLAQQAAEKAVKAAHQEVGAEAWGHSVAELLLALDPEPGDDTLAAARALDRHYIPTRYPDSHQQGAPADLYTRRDADQALADAGVIMDHVRRRPPA